MADWQRRRYALAGRDRRRYALAGREPRSYPGRAPVPSAASAALACQLLVQPDRTTCGSASLVLARMIADPEYCQQILGREDDRRTPGLGPVGAASNSAARRNFTEAALDMHRRTNRWHDADGAWQLAWPRSLGTSPWAAARQLTMSTNMPGVRYRMAVVDPLRADEAYLRVLTTVRGGLPCALFVGDALCPRHVVLVVAVDVAVDPDGLIAYEPSAGGLRGLDRERFVTGQLSLAGWDEPWLAVLPD